MCSVDIHRFSIGFPQHHLHRDQTIKNLLLAVAGLVWCLDQVMTFSDASSSSGGVRTGDEPQKISAVLGENVILNCPFDFPDGESVPFVVQWTKLNAKIPIYIWYDGYPPHMGEGYEGRVSLSGQADGQAALSLINVQETDQGWYECKVYFLNRPPEPVKNGTWVHLDVHGECPANMYRCQ